MEGVGLIREGRVAASKAAAGDVDGDVDALERWGHDVIEQRDPELIVAARARVLIAAVAQGEIAPSDGDALPEHLLIAVQDRARLLAGIRLAIWIGRLQPAALRIQLLIIRADRVERRPIRPVAVPGREVGDGRAPQRVPDLIPRREQGPLLIGEAQLSEGLSVIGEAVPVQVQLGQPVGLPDHGDDAPVIGGHPDPELTIVVAHRHGAADREAQVVVHVVIERPIEPHAGGPGLQGRVHAQLHRVGVGAHRRQLRGHRVGAVLAHGVLRDPDHAVRQRHGGAVGHHHRALDHRRDDQGRRPGPVGVHHRRALRHLERRGLKGDRVGHRIKGGHHHVADEGEVGPGHLHLAIRREVARRLKAQPHPPAAVHHEVKAAVVVGHRPAEIGLIRRAHLHPSEGRPARQPDLPAHHRDAVRRQGLRRDLVLRRLGALGQERHALFELRGPLGIGQGVDGRRIRRGLGIRAGRADPTTVHALLLG